MTPPSASLPVTALSRREAQRIAVAAQALGHPPVAAGKADVLHLLRRLGCIQIDTIHVVARSPYFVLWSRLGQYDPRWLDELLFPDRLVFEYWAHAASIIPIEHWPLFRAAMLRHARGEDGWWREWRVANASVIDTVRDQIRARGPLGAADFAAPPGHRGSWWEWKPAKRALDALWSSGELMIERRVNFHRRYELRERLLPDWDDAPSNGHRHGFPAGRLFSPETDRPTGGARSPGRRRRGRARAGRRLGRAGLYPSRADAHGAAAGAEPRCFRPLTT